MPNVTADQLTDLAMRILGNAGVSQDEAEIVTRHCVAADLAGHHSHGVIQIPQYVQRIQQGHIMPGAPFEITQETPTTTVIDGHWGFGFVVTERALHLTLEKARQRHVAAATIYRQGHIGRLTDYALMAADAGMICLITADSGRGPKAVAPFGGRTARLGTNPICIAIPSTLDAPLYIDMATSAVAAGKINVARQSGANIPQGWVIDAEGRAALDPAALSQGGALMPLGGSEGHKGYGLAVMVEVLSGILTGLGFGVEPSGRHNDGCFLALFNVAAFRPLAEFKAEVAEFARYLADSPPAAGVERVYYPGELEYLRTQQRLAEGVPMDDAIWARLRAFAAEHGKG